jgi:hypothetical protein
MILIEKLGVRAACEARCANVRPSAQLASVCGNRTKRGAPPAYDARHRARTEVAGRWSGPRQTDPEVKSFCEIGLVETSLAPESNQQAHRLVEIVG